MERGRWSGFPDEEPAHPYETTYRARPSSALSRPTRPIQTTPSHRQRPEEQTLIVPAFSRSLVRTVPEPRAAKPTSSGSRWSRPLMFFGVVLTVIVVLVVSAAQALQGGGTPSAQTPPPTGRGPWSSSANSVRVVIPPTVVPGAPLTINSIEPCHDANMFLSTITQWSVPPGCYANIYQPNPANYVQRPGFGYCNWWVRVTHPNHPDITENMSYPRGSKPAVGAAVFFDGNEQGATSAGHWAEVVGIDPDNYWVLISEMNFEWRGAGFGRIDYRYIHVSPGVHFVYVFN